MLKSVVFLVICYASFAYKRYETLRGRELPGKGFLSRQRSSWLQASFFPSLENYQVGASPAHAGSYPWVARVVHSPTDEHPHVCTAVCIDERIFITAARCLYGLKINYTRVLYLNHRYVVTAFIVPSEPTKQGFDDIGFLVVEHQGSVGHTWATIQLYDGPKRTDADFKWFENLRLHEQPVQHRAVGYAVNKFVHRVRDPFTRYHLSGLDVVVGRNMCAEIFSMNRIVAFHVPCYLSCSIHQYRSNDPKCQKYLGVEGGAVYNFKTNKLLGIATWGAYFYKHELPVGFAVPNSVYFNMDFDCAKKVRDDPSYDIVKGYYQALCNDMSFKYRY